MSLVVVAIDTIGFNDLVGANGTDGDDDGSLLLLVIDVINDKGRWLIISLFMLDY